MHSPASTEGRRGALAPATLLLLALCLLAGGALAANVSQTTASSAAGPSGQAVAGASVPAAVGYETPIAVRDADQQDPAILGTRVVWQDWRNNDWYPGKIIAESQGDIYSYNLTSHIEQPEGASVSQYGKYVPDDFDPVISDAGIFWVWWGRSDADTNNEIRGRTLQGEPVNVTLVGMPASRYLSDPAIDGDRLVYVLNDHRLVLYDTETRYVDTIRETADELRTPAVSGDTVAWQQYNGFAWSLYWYRLSEGEFHTMPWTSPEPLSLALEGTTLVWADHRNATWDISACDILDPYATEHAVVEGPGDQVNPAVSGNRVAWQDNRSGNWDIYLGSLSGGAVSTVCTAPGDQASPAIDGDRIVWQDGRNGNWDVFMFTLSSSPPVPVPTPARLIITSPGTYAITSDGYDGIATPVEIRSSDVVLDGGGHTVDGADRRGTSGIRIVGPVSNVVVRDVRLSNWETGISADGVTGSVIEGCEIAHNFRGIALNHSPNAEVRENRIEANDVTGVAVADSADATVRENGIRRTGDGFTVYAGAGSFEETYTFAVQVAGSNRAAITGNDLGGWFTSLFLTGSASVRVTGNQLTGTKCGIIAFSAGDGTVVYDNVFRSSWYSVYGNFAGTVWNTTPSPGPNVVGGPLVGGNFWGKTDGAGFSETTPDANGDGFCDLPYAIPMGGTDEHPLAPWSGPALAVLPGGAGLPTDTNADGKADDVNGNGRGDFNDVVLFFNQMSWVAANEPVALFDFNGNGRIDFADVVWLFSHL